MNRILSVIFLFTIISPIFLIAQVKKTLAVLEMDAEGVSESEVRVISQRIRTVLFETGYFTVLERDKMDAVLKEQGFQQSGCTSDECAVEIGRLIGTQLMVAGSIGKVGSLFTVNARIIDVETGQVIRTAIEDCRCPIEDVLTESTQKIVNILIGTEIRSSQELNKSNDENIEFGFLGGFIISNGYKTNLYNYNEKESISGFNIGFFITSKLNENFSIKPEIVYITKGLKTIDVDDDDADKYNLNYLDISTFLSYSISDNFKIITGPFLEIFLVGEYIDIYDDEEDKYDIKKIDNPGYGLESGIEYYFRNFFISYRFALSLNTIELYGDTGPDPFKFKNYNSQFIVGYTF